LKKLARAIRATLRRQDAVAAAADAAAVAEASRVLSTLREEASGLHEALVRLRHDTENARQRAADVTTRHRRDLQQRASLAALGGPRLLSDALTLDGRPSERLAVTRSTVGERIARPFSPHLGLTRCAAVADEVRTLWERLLAFESSSGDVLEGHPATVLDMRDAHASVRDGSLAVSLRRPLSPSRRLELAGVPRFTYAVPPRKLRNFGHWLLDCLPQITAISAVAPEAMVLLPQPPNAFQRATLSAIGFDESRLVAWNGDPIDCGRLVAFESDGRTGGGRPLSPLMELRRTFAPPAPAARVRKLYVSRRDARKKRRWVENELDVEHLFRSRGFEIVDMATCSFEEQVRLFREARVVAGISGAGLSDLIFSAPGTDVIVLITEGLIRWYADQRGARSLWAGGTRARRGHLAALGDSPRFYAHLAAAFEQRCHSFVGPDRVPTGEVSAFVDEVLGGMEQP
jgi:hypothetical protein